VVNNAADSVASAPAAVAAPANNGGVAGAAKTPGGGVGVSVVSFQLPPSNLPAPPPVAAAPVTSAVAAVSSLAPLGKLCFWSSSKLHF
jgi:hypothetical protein